MAKIKLTCIAEIQCRFPSDGREIRSLGEKLKNATTQHFQPYFVIGEKDSNSNSSKIIFTSELTQKMMMNASFDVGRVQIPVSGETAITTISLSMIPGEELPISGFPRALTVKKPTKGIFVASLYSYQILSSVFHSILSDSY